MTKPFLSFENQIKYLEEDKGLIISDRVFAKSMLMQIGYFGLIGGYKTPFKDATTHKYRNGITFDDIVALYKFDENLRELFLKYIFQIERHIRALLSNHFAEKYGEAQIHYLNPKNFSSEPRHKKNVARLIGDLNNLANITSDYPYINHQRKKYGNVPLWVIVNALTFGSLSKFYLLSTPDIRVKVAKNFKCVTDKQLQQYLTVITKFRNVCAHNERLYSYQTNEDIPDTVLHSKLGIAKRGSQYISGKRDLFALVIAFRYLLPEEDFKKFKKCLIQIIRHYLQASNAITEEKLNRIMGFPSNWQEISKYKK